MGRKKILIVEDEVVIRSSLKKILEEQSFKVTEAESLADLQARSFDDYCLIISDLGLAGTPGTDLITMAPGVPVVITTDEPSVESAVAVMKMGAADYVAKPFDYDSLLKAVFSLTASAWQPSRPISHTKPASNRRRAVTREISGMLGTCGAMKDLFGRIGKVAPTNTNVLIMGESGTGKELVARALHEGSPQAGREMISLNCAAIPDSLIESELFGHERGAFTGATSTRVGLVEAADRSTLFLDEIGELPLEAQARLLRVLQEGEVRRVGSVTTRKVSVRLIAATHRDLKSLTRRGEFREDLYYRLNVVKLSLPPLRERHEDLMPLAEMLLRQNCESLGKPCLRFSSAAVDLITSYHWPGNIRELENAIERAVILSDSVEIPADLLAIEAEPGETTPVPDEALSLEDYFQQFVLANQDVMTETELAKRLGISRKALWQKRQKLKLPRERSRRA